MDPNLFHIDWERLFEVLVAIVVLAFLLERAMALFFENRLFINNFEEKGLKEIIAFVVGALVCWYWDFDAVSMIFLKQKITIPGTIITGAVVAGGSKASVKLFRDLLGFMSAAEAKRQAVLEAQKAEAKRQAVLEAQREAGG